MNSKECLELLFKNVKENFNKRIRFKNYEVPKLEKDCYNTIKQDLDRLEELEKENQKLKEEKQKLENAIYILKEKYADTSLISKCSLEEYNDHIYEDYQLTQEEYELLKEVFDGGK